MKNLLFFFIIALFCLINPSIGDEDFQNTGLDGQIDYIQANIIPDPVSEQVSPTQNPVYSSKPGKPIDSGARFTFLLGPVRLYHPFNSSEENLPTLNSVIFMGDYVFTDDYGELTIKTPGDFLITLLPNSHLLIGQAPESPTSITMKTEPDLSTDIETGPDIEQDTPQVLYSDTNTDEPVSIRIGETDIIALSENPTTGYQWEVTTTKGLQIISDSYQTDGNGQIIGRGGVHTWSVRAQREGVQTFNAVYRRSFEPVTGEEKTYRKDYSVLPNEETKTDIQVTLTPEDTTPIPTHPIVPDISECEWGGIWDSSFGKMVLSQNGKIVEGEYEHDEGRISGKIEGNRLSGTWYEGYGGTVDESGDVEFIMSDDCMSFSGKWGHGSGENWSGQWNGKRI